MSRIATRYFLVAALAPLLGCGGADIEEIQNLVEPGATTGSGLRGDPSVLFQSLAPEGAEPSADNAVELVEPASQIVVDLRRTVSISEILVQADNRSRLRLEVSVDGRSWQGVWQVPSVLTGVGIPPMGLRSRTQLIRGVTPMESSGLCGSRDSSSLITTESRLRI